MSYRQFLDEIEKGLPSKSYLLISSDHFLHAEAASLIRELVPPEERDFNFHSFDLLAPEQESASLDRVLDVVNTVPFFAGRKFVVIGNFQKTAKKDLKKMEDYLQRPSETTVLVLLHEGGLKKDAKEMLKGVRQIVLDIREADVPAWVVAKARLRGLEISRDAVAYLLAVIGPDLGMLSTEIEKLTLVGRPSIGRDDIAEVVEGKRTYGAFDLINAIRARDAEKTFRIYGILRETEEPFSLLGALNWQYAQLMGAKNSPGEKEYLYNVFHLLNRADMGIKTGGFYPLEMLLVKLLRLSAPR
jgi:DNA polymerase-3 subunit delta